MPPVSLQHFTAFVLAGAIRRRLLAVTSLCTAENRGSASHDLHAHYGAD